MSLLVPESRRWWWWAQVVTLPKRSMNSSNPHATRIIACWHKQQRRANTTVITARLVVTSLSLCMAPICCQQDLCGWFPVVIGRNCGALWQTIIGCLGKYPSAVSNDSSSAYHQWRMVSMLFTSSQRWKGKEKTYLVQRVCWRYKLLLDKVIRTRVFQSNPVFSPWRTWQMSPWYRLGSGGTINVWYQNRYLLV